MVRRLLAIGALAFTCSCSDPTGVNSDFGGSWQGAFSIAPDQLYRDRKAYAQLSQNGNRITGTFTTNTGRWGNVSGELLDGGKRLSLQITFQDQCGGILYATTDMDIRYWGGNAPLGPEFYAPYATTDCLGHYSGRLGMSSCRGRTCDAPVAQRQSSLRNSIDEDRPR